MLYSRFLCMCVSRSVASNHLQPRGLQPTRILYPWNSPGRILEWVAISSSRRSSQPRDQTQVSCTAGGFLPSKPPGKPRFLLVTYFISYWKPTHTHKCTHVCACAHTHTLLYCPELPFPLDFLLSLSKQERGPHLLSSCFANLREPY